MRKGVCIMMYILFSVVAVAGGIMFLNAPWVKRARVRKKAEEKKLEVSRIARMVNFKKQKFVVYVRTKDGRKSSFESVLIGALLSFSVREIEPLKEINGRAVADGDTASLNDTLAIIGTSWNNSCGTKCDYRLLSAKTGILGAGNIGPYLNEEFLAKIIVEDLAINFPEKNES